MSDMIQTIAAKSDQLNADDLMAGAITIEVTGVSVAAGDQPVSISYRGDNGKPYKPCKTMRRAIVACWGASSQAYVGRSMTLYRDAVVRFGGMDVGGIRISHMSHMDGKKTLALMASKGKKSAVTIMPLATTVQAKTETMPAIDLIILNEDGRDAANKGMDALLAWWKGLQKHERDALGGLCPAELKEIAASIIQN